jgi:hypothetical protein
MDCNPVSKSTRVTLFSTSSDPMLDILSFLGAPNRLSGKDWAIATISGVGR